MEFLEILKESIAEIGWRELVMWAIGGILIFLAIKFEIKTADKNACRFYFYCLWKTFVASKIAELPVELINTDFHSSNVPS